ncbi:hypothetical protein SLEP1_g23267 [Rubroshorea leprosula]|uniref:Uncharacterized protein n=1 Tax=Rubroshorea leprosula TaxID=152421 RepID=A0AAV5JJ20_9ROSI|nr:hypothetical protein SLEP1_g23267 [Rubroshorea leprosula]
MIGEDEIEAGDKDEGKGEESTVVEEVGKKLEILGQEGEGTRFEPQAMGGDAFYETGMTKSYRGGLVVAKGTGGGKAGRGAKDGGVSSAGEGRGAKDGVVSSAGEEEGNREVEFMEG